MQSLQEVIMRCWLQLALLVFVLCGTFDRGEVWAQDGDGYPDDESQVKQVNNSGQMTPAQVQQALQSGQLTQEQIQLWLSNGQIPTEQTQQGVREIEGWGMSEMEKAKQAGLTPAQIDAELKKLEQQKGGKGTKKSKRKGLYEQQEPEKLTAEEAEKLTAEEKEMLRAVLFFPEKKDLFIRVFGRDFPELNFFGHELFTGTPKAFAPLKDIPVSNDYLIGPGDTVKIQMWGRIDASYTLDVDPEGVINFPKLGPITVAGLTFQEMKDQITRQAEAITGVNVNISMGRLKTIQVFVFGEVKRPGLQTVSSLATAVHALLMSGGPTVIGSLRKVELRRQGHTISTLDLYDFLLKGDISTDSRLMPGDVIFVPKTGPLVAVTGNVKRPAVYETKAEQTLEGVLKLAGDLSPRAYNQRLQIQRAAANKLEVIMDIPYTDMQRYEKTTLADGDIVNIFSIMPSVANAVYLYGNIKRPGEYAYKEGLRLRNLIPDVESLEMDSFYDYAVIKRYHLEDMTSELIAFDLGKLLSSNSKDLDIALKPLDEVYVFNKWAFQDKPYATIEGEVRQPDKYETIDGREGRQPSKYETIDNREGRQPSKYETIDNREGRQPNKYETIEDREVRQPDKYETIDNREVRQLNKFETIDNSGGRQPSKYETIDGREVRKPSKYETIDNRKIRQPDKYEIIEGREGRQPSKYEIFDGMRVSDLVFKAGNLSRNASLGLAHLYRTDPRTKEVTIHFFNLEKAMAGDPEHNLLLKNLDNVIIHSVLEYTQKYTVAAQGMLNEPGKFPYAINMTVRDLILMAGHVKDSAFMEKAEILRFNIEEGKKIETAILTFSPALALKGDPEHNIALQPLDVMTIQPIPDWREAMQVEISGEVVFPGTYNIRKDERLSSVIERAGGFTDKAYFRGTAFTRESVKFQQQKRLDEITERLSREIAQTTVSEMSTAISGEAVTAQKESSAAQTTMLERLKALKAEGRVVIKLAPGPAFTESSYNLALEDKDKLHIPTQPDTVAILGEVYNPTSIIYTSDHAKLGYYLAQTGGPTDYAEEDQMYILRADGTVESKGMGSYRSLFSSFESSVIYPGDTLVVPPKLIHTSIRRELKDWSSILFQLAVTAGITITQVFQ